MTPMTREQLQWIETQVHRAANEASRRTRNRALVAFLALVAALGYVQWSSSTASSGARDAIRDSGTVIAVDGCNRDYESRKEIREVLKRSKDFQKTALARGDISQAQYNAAVVFYDERLLSLPLPDCRAAAKILTSNPDEVPAVPRPKHP